MRRVSVLPGWGSSQGTGFPGHRWCGRGVSVARRTFDVTDVTEILVHWYAGRSQSEVATSLGVDRKTIRKYLAPAMAAGMAPGGPPMTTVQWAELVEGWFPEIADTRLRQTTWPEIEKHRDYIADMLKIGVT